MASSLPGRPVLCLQGRGERYGPLLAGELRDLFQLPRARPKISPFERRGRNGPRHCSLPNISPLQTFRLSRRSCQTRRNMPPYAAASSPRSTIYGCSSSGRAARYAASSVSATTWLPSRSRSSLTSSRLCPSRNKASPWKKSLARRAWMQVGRARC